MDQPRGLRERKKAQTRQLIADTAAQLFAAEGFDRVSILDVARAADVSDQTVYNYFPAKHDLVLDMAEEFRQRYARAVLERPAGTSPAAAVRALAAEDIERYRHGDLALARGEFPALSVSSPSIHRFALEMFDRQAETIAVALTDTTPGLPAAIARAHGAALISVFQHINDSTGRAVLEGTPPNPVADALTADVAVVLDDLDRHFLSLAVAGSPATEGRSRPSAENSRPTIRKGPSSGSSGSDC